MSGKKKKKQLNSGSSISPKPVTIKKQIAFVGKTNSGKSTTANMLCGTQFKVGPIHGVTTAIERSRYLDTSYDVVDTPGILDTTDYSSLIRDTVAESEIVVFVTTGQMYQQEYDFFKNLATSRQKNLQTIIVFINKDDLKSATQSSCEIATERRLICEQVQAYCDDVVFGAAAPIRNGQRQSAEIVTLRNSIHQRLK